MYKSFCFQTNQHIKRIAQIGPVYIVFVIHKSYCIFVFMDLMSLDMSIHFNDRPWKSTTIPNMVLPFG